MTVWTPPRTWIVGEALTAANLNSNLRDDMNMVAGSRPLGIGSAASLNPAGTTSTTGVMMGLAVALGLFTPVISGRVLVIACGDGHNSVGGDGWTTGIRSGTGTAPANGAALAGSALSAPIGSNGTGTTANLSTAFGIVGMQTAMTIGTPYWFDLSCAAFTGGTATLTGVNLVVIEI